MLKFRKVSGSEIPEKFWSGMLENAREDQLDRSCKKWSITQSQGEEEYPTHNKKEER